jgi:WD40 repeat protein
LWDLESGTCERILADFAVVALSPDQRFLLYSKYPGSMAAIYDFEQRRHRELPSHGTQVFGVAWHPSGEWLATGSVDGTVRVGPVTGEEPHLLYGHEALIFKLAFHPDGDSLASASEDNTVRLWPMPEGTPLHMLPREEVIARLHALTNYRVVEDPDSLAGYQLTLAPFPGWEKVPTW